jgi:hypothetical protein
MGREGTAGELVGDVRDRHRIRALLHRSRLLAALCISLSLLLPSAADASGAPEISATWVTNVTATSAVLRAEVNPNGLATKYSFQYITAAALETNLAEGHEGFLGARSVPLTNNGLGSGTVSQAVSFSLSAPSNPLQPGTEYRFRALATNSASATPVTGLEHKLRTPPATPLSGLPDDRAWELVSPIDKGGGAVAAPGALFGGGLVQATAGGSARTFSSASAFAQPLGAPPASQYLASREPSGWLTANLSPPLGSSVYGDHPDGAPYRLFSPDLTRGLLNGGDPCAAEPGCPTPAPPMPGSGAPSGYQTYYLRTAGGAYTSLLNDPDLTHTTVSPQHFRLGLATAVGDLSTVILSSCAALTADATEVVFGPGECSEGAQNLYRWSGGVLTLVNLLPGDTTGTPGAAIAAPIGAVSEDGSRVYFTESEDALLYLREAGGPTRPVEETLPGRGQFQTASADGSIAFLTASGHLYRYQATNNTAVDITPGGEVSGVLGASADGARVYFQDATGLELWDEGTTTLVAAGADATVPSDHPPATATVRLSADGRQIAFLSRAPLGGYDNLDAETHLPDTELYLFDAVADHLVCASCNPAGERPQGSASIPGAQANGSTTLYRPRALSENGRRLFFDSSDDLLGTDTDTRSDVYQWEAQGEGDCVQSPGCLSLISGGHGEGGTFLDASSNGADVFFLTGDSLVQRDPGSIDAYDARVGGGIPEPQPPIPCVGDACQPLPFPPDDPNPGTTLPNSGNPAPHYYKPQKKKHRKHRRHSHHAHKKSNHKRPGHG